MWRLGLIVPVAASGIAASWAGSLLAGLGLPPATGNRSIRFHPDGHAAQQALLHMIGAAERRVLLATCILGADGPGDALVAALVGRARAGVEVCVLLDALGRLRCGRRPAASAFDYRQRQGVLARRPVLRHRVAPDIRKCD